MIYCFCFVEGRIGLVRHGSGDRSRNPHSVVIVDVIGDRVRHVMREYDKIVLSFEM